MSKELIFPLAAGAWTSGGFWLLLATGGVWMRGRRETHGRWLLSRHETPRLYRTLVTILAAVFVGCVLGLVLEIAR